jgi:hypothetical protein
MSAMSDEFPAVATVVLPRDGLVPSADLEAVRSLQLIGTEVRLVDGDLQLRGTELAIERAWLNPLAWTQFRHWIDRGYIARMTDSRIVVRVDRRARSRRVGQLLARMKALSDTN